MHRKTLRDEYLLIRSGFPKLRFDSSDKYEFGEEEEDAIDQNIMNDSEVKSTLQKGLVSSTKEQKRRKN
jgi:hypothetical protein